MPSACLSMPASLERALTHRSYAYGERQPADQRAAGIPRRPRCSAWVVTRHLVPRLPEPARGAVGQAPRRGGPDGRAGRGWRASSAWRLRQARPRRAGDRRAEQALDPGRHARGRDRRGCTSTAAWTRPGLWCTACSTRVIARSARLGAGLERKTSLQEAHRGQDARVPDYQVEESGADHQKSSAPRSGSAAQVLGDGQGRTKKAARTAGRRGGLADHHGRGERQPARRRRRAIRRPANGPAGRGRAGALGRA